MKEETLKDRIKNNNSIRDIANEFNTGYSTIRYWLKKYNLSTGKLSFKDTGKKDIKLKFCRDCKNNLISENTYKHVRGICKKCFSKRKANDMKLFKVSCVKYKGGSCIKCGYNKSLNAMDFHHRDPKEKDFDVSKYRTQGKILSKDVLNELDKCDLLCCRCHRELHDLDLIENSSLD